MKKFILKILVSVLVISSLSSLGFITKNDEAKAATRAVIYTTQKKAKKIGYTFSTTKTISRKDLNKISDYLDNNDASRNAQLGVVTTILTAPLSPYISIGAGLGATLLSSYIETNGKLVSSKLKKSSKKTFKVKITYRYRFGPREDGYYYISNVKIY
ncbi:hypothetical protein [Bacillus haynesii]|uniref:Uncharacterized protein n=1 Tax=Bacillus haynesii TaxID=1925021 RepID=A0ABX3I897_9BACI|nr:hypothetical protein [Bacillus haynesii]EWH21645.1 hypothetical protein M769_0113495 [Bacillus haynesii]OMI30296.1 hypothetical protein BTA31_01675 [Bacillus haynesii]